MSNVPQALYAAHGHLNKGELEKAAKEFEKAASDAEETINVRISCFLNAGACLISLGDYEKGLVCLESARGLLSAPPPPPDSRIKSVEEDREMTEAVADVHYNSAIAYQALGDYDRAVPEFQQCLALYEKYDRPQRASEVLSALASCHCEAGQHEKEIVCLAKLQVVYRGLGDSGSEAVTCATLAQAHLRAGREEECRQMLSMAKMISIRVDDQNLLGRLFTHCGLIHSSLHQYDKALCSFEQALSLVRQAGSGGGDQMNEATLLQNVGATYNEKQMYSESLAYHREAASMHGKLNSYESEIKSLCNLAFAQSQLRDYPSAIASLTEALERAHAIENPLLKLQACECLGACYYHRGQYSEAIGAFNDAFQLLDKIEQDTSIERARVMGKLSDATKALQKAVDMNVKENLQLSSRQCPETFDAPLTKFNGGGLDESMEDREQQQQQQGKHPCRKDDEQSPFRPTTLQNQDSCDGELQAYLVSSEENSDHEQVASAEQPIDTTDHPTSHNHRTEPQEPAITPVSSSQPSVQGETAAPLQLPVTEGSLAIGPDARKMYTVQSSSRKEAKGGRKGRRDSSGSGGATVIVKRENAQHEGEYESHSGNFVPGSVRSSMCQIM